jgi:hypothetical protein
MVGRLSRYPWVANGTNRCEVLARGERANVETVLAGEKQRGMMPVQMARVDDIRDISVDSCSTQAEVRL